ncbi:Putative Mn2+ efflux pump MntP [Alteribacillus persepolensis]|uniref:Putative manganese efflux pump MntP n=1 Tax=Alteribacillus persepolensis TaxID=568899 RepID=A0A1G8HCW4_9BACI|nr:manganese efflux pump MntP family protein [Alteribacillus persepolensis]SDI04439.1 Putative Mn2+ efflux pump MntP [Alteribacillus persepolensis]
MGGWLVLAMMASALSMDAFSMSLAVAMKGARRINKLYTACVVGFFHMLMPFLGLFGGRWIASSFEQIAIITGGVLLLIIGGQMVWAGWKNDGETGGVIVPVGIGLFLFAVLVSLDSFSIGITLGILNAPLAQVLCMFGLFSACFTWAGLTLGHHLQYTLGRYSEIFGGVILFGFGLKLIM